MASEGVGPPLVSGDVMTPAEFHRRYAFHPKIKSAELIEGVVHLASRLRARDNGDQDSDMNAWLGGYRASHSDVRVSSKATVILDHDNEVQPDSAFVETRQMPPPESRRKAIWRDRPNS